MPRTTPSSRRLQRSCPQRMRPERHHISCSPDRIAGRNRVMSHPEATMQLQRTQRLLYLLAILVFLASMVELLAAKHYKELEQLIPFAIAIIGILSVLGNWLRPTTWT